MSTLLNRVYCAAAAALALTLPALAADSGWESLFDGRSLAGWRAAEHPGSFRVEDGAIVADGPRAHLFYLGGDGAAQFENFEFSIEVKAMPHANSGVYFLARWADSGWPTQAGFEAQVNNTQPPFEVGAPGAQNLYRENKKTGSLYGVRNLYKALVRDGEWFTMTITVRRPRVQIHVNDVLTADYIEPANLGEPGGRQVNRLAPGTFALQCHDEQSRVYFRNIRVRRLPPGVDRSVVRPVADAAEVQRLALGKDNFPLLDLHTHVKGGLTLEKAMDVSRTTGMGLGLATNGGRGFPIQDDAAAQAFIEQMKGVPVFLALQAEGREWTTMFSLQTCARFDYVFTDAMTWTNRAGKRLRLWIPEEADIGPDPEAFMDELVAAAVSIISTEPIDIYVNPTFLPEAIAANYDELWTESRMQQVIEAAVKHGVAIEINARYRLPSEKFLRLAKAAGAKFTIGTNNASAADFGDWSYPMEMQGKLGLSWRDMWVPGHAPSRTQRMLGR
ncbi:DUF1080 domain-containing protein [Opitutus terrae]|uniref:3-keto-alpha-glucoside-1,2-lyase/3-keto-2-hydroxy-glucal hydratase domain-containing protein n=1 Tax=Opitutus terrae (strain DSM 11246 / JCM 15787 / PB90-1) TaxID=452637 RepID=B1ZN75_OPITP|nr:DUF1080 domain-containing protein [Opitutus terrae]ACB73444.1 protein of unknown function DUF1080 [Opitutus terrae PB90-1]